MELGPQPGAPAQPQPTYFAPADRSISFDDEQAPLQNFRPAPGQYHTFGDEEDDPTSPTASQLSLLGCLNSHDFGPKGAWSALQNVMTHEKLNFSLWPHFFTAACLAVYGTPSITLAHLATDESVRYWIGPDGLYAPLIPATILALHVVHLKLGLPRLIPVIFSSVVPAMVLFVLANKHLLTTKTQAEMLLSKDCRTFPRKGEVHHSWVVANEVFSGCINRTAIELHRPIAEVHGIRRFQDCREWTTQKNDPWAEHRRAWKYLRKLEENNGCGGWCWVAPPIWTYEEPKDACSYTAGAALMGKAAPVAVRLLIFSGLGGAVATLGILRFEKKFPEIW